MNQLEFLNLRVALLQREIECCQEAEKNYPNQDSRLFWTQQSLLKLSDLFACKDLIRYLESTGLKAI